MKTYHFLKRDHFFSIPGRTWAKIELNASVDVFTFIANFKHCDLKDLILKFLHSYKLTKLQSVTRYLRLTLISV